MYTIHNDGVLLHGASFADDLLSPQLSLDVNGAGSLTFVMPPGHAQYDSIRKLNGIITVEQGGKTLFRGRALDDERDFFNQKNVYCEGDRSFLLDSQCAPYTYTGTALGLFGKLIAEHNEQVDIEKRFAIGNVTAVSNETLTVENVAYWDTWKELDEKLLSVYGGYMMTRTEDGTTYLDWLAVSGKTNSQEITFSVNLLDLKDKADAADVFTILIPLGASSMGDDGEYSDPVSIESVNGGLKYIQDDDAVAQYGKIWRTKTWNYVEDPNELLEKGREYLKTGIALQTLTLHAIDMHFIDGSAEAIRVGDHVRIISQPHGLDITIICTKIDIDLVNPENTTYTFGEPPRTLTENVVRTEDSVDNLTGGGGGGGGRSVKEELKDYIRWAEIRIDEDEAMIELLTGQAHSIDNRLSKAEITLDGVNAQIVLKADVETTNELGRRVSAAEIEIDGLNSEIILKADKIDLQGYVTAQQLETAKAEIEVAWSELIRTDTLYVTGDASITNTLTAGHISASGSFRFNGSDVSKTSIRIITGISGGGVNGTDATLLTTSVGGAYTIEAGSADAVYSNGMQATHIQGEEYTGFLYAQGTTETVKEQGNLFTGSLFYSGGEETVTLQGSQYYGAYEDGGSETVTVQGSAYSQGTLYVQTGGVYRAVGRTLYEAGSSRTFYKRGSGISEPLYRAGAQKTFYKRGEDYPGALYEPGKSRDIKVQGDMLTVALYYEGTKYANGLYTNFSPATITLQDITALTA